MINFMYRICKPPRDQTSRRGAMLAGQTMFSATMVALTIMAVLMGFRIFRSADTPKIIKIGNPTAQAAGSTAGAPMVKPARNPNRPLVGIVSGHRGYDPGAVCNDGLTEAAINYTIAQEVVNLLERRDIQADLLDEYDEWLTDYQADALVSIHSDSCNIPGATGFKTARVTHSAIPTAEDRLVACLNQEYTIHTGLPQHTASITDNMTDYHAFNEINPFTPGAIIETGFMLDDRFLLQYRPKIVARGIAAGIICFLEE